MRNTHVTVLCTIVLALLALGSRPAAAQSLPTDFTIDTIASGFSEAVGFTMLPDGRFLVIEQRTAHVKIVAGSSIATIATIPNVRSDANERGLLGIDVDPRWPQQPYLYFYYTHRETPTGPTNQRLIRFTASGDLSNGSSTSMSLGSSYTIIDDIPHNASNHNGGTIRFGPDGMLYVSVGEDANPCAAQQFDDLRGVILRLDLRALPATGSGPPAKSAIVAPGNPFAGNDNARLAWAYGLRNPYRFNIDPLTGDLFIADVGAATQEELDHCTGGENFGWPWFEGTAQGAGCGGVAPSVVGPIATFSRPEGQSMIAFGFYRNRADAPHKFGNDYRGSAFYVDFYTGRVRRVHRVGNAWTAPAPVPGQPNAQDWATGLSFVSQAIVADDGAIYFTNHAVGSLQRLRYVPRLPTLTVAGVASTGTSLPVTVSRDPGDQVLLYLGTSLVNAQPLANHFGARTVDGFVFAGGTTDGAGNFVYTFPPIPSAAVGLTVHFQAVVASGSDNFISPHATTTVVSPQ